MIDFATLEQYRKPLLVGARLLELGSPRVNHRLCLPRCLEQGGLVFFFEGLVKLCERGGMHGLRSGKRSHGAVVIDFSIAMKGGESLLLGMSLRQLGSQAVQQFPSLSLLQEERELMFVRQGLLKLGPLGSMCGQHAFVTDLTIGEQRREPLLLGTRLFELGSHAVEQLLCLLLLEEHRSLSGFARVCLVVAEGGLGARSIRDSVLELLAEIVELLGDLALAQRRLEPKRH